MKKCEFIHIYSGSHESIMVRRFPLEVQDKPTYLAVTPHQGMPMTAIMQKLKTFAKRDLLDVLLLCLCFAVGWYAYGRSSICANSAKQDIQDVVETPKMVGIEV